MFLRHKVQPNGGFLKWGYPQIIRKLIHFSMKTHGFGMFWGSPTLRTPKFQITGPLKPKLHVAYASTKELKHTETISEHGSYPTTGRSEPANSWLQLTHLQLCFGAPFQSNSWAARLDASTWTTRQPSKTGLPRMHEGPFWPGIPTCEWPEIWGYTWQWHMEMGNPLWLNWNFMENFI